MICNILQKQKQKYKSTQEKCKRKQSNIREGIWSYWAMEEEGEGTTSSCKYSVQGALLKEQQREQAEIERALEGIAERLISFIHSVIDLTNIYCAEHSK